MAVVETNFDGWDGYDWKQTYNMYIHVYRLHNDSTDSRIVRNHVEIEL